MTRRARKSRKPLWTEKLDPKTECSVCGAALERDEYDGAGPPTVGDIVRLWYQEPRCPNGPHSEERAGLHAEIEEGIAP